MSNPLDYLHWRGDISFTTAPFNEVDNLILSMCSFLDLEQLIPSSVSGPQPTLREAMSWFDNRSGRKSKLALLIPERVMDIIRSASESKRFGDVRVCAFVNHVDDVEVTQFSATTYLLPDLTLFLSFRGTDDTIAGWKENLNLCLDVPVPAEVHAVKYVIQIASEHYGRMRLGGHSKGGHLSIRAAADVPSKVQARIITAFSNDGPGFLPAFYETPGYQAIRNRVFTLIPQSSIVGTLLEQDKRRCFLIRSTENGVMQHDPFSWQVDRTSFERLSNRSRFGKITDEAFKQWIGSMSLEERRSVLNCVFEILDSTGARTLTELDRSKLKNLLVMSRAMREQPPETRKMMFGVFQNLFRLEDDKMI